MLLFKEKINYKLAGSGEGRSDHENSCTDRLDPFSGGFAPHIDSTAYTHIKDIKHLTVLLAVDPTNAANGGLEVVDASHQMHVPIGKDNCIEPTWVAQQKWIPVNLEAGMPSTPIVIYSFLG